MVVGLITKYFHLYHVQSWLFLIGILNPLLVKVWLSHFIRPYCPSFIAYIVKYVAFGYFFAGLSLAMFPVDNPIPSDGFTFIVSPITLVINMSCLNFQYYLRSNLRIYISNSSLSKTVADFHVDGGFDFHRAFIDLRPGKYQIIWETQWDQTPMEVVRNYRAAIDDVQITSGRCEDLRKYILVVVVKSMSFGVNLACFKTPCDCF